VCGELLAGSFFQAVMLEAFRQFVPPALKVGGRRWANIQESKQVAVTPKDETVLALKAAQMAELIKLNPRPRNEAEAAAAFPINKFPPPTPQLHNTATTVQRNKPGLLLYPKYS